MSEELTGRIIKQISGYYDLAVDGAIYRTRGRGSLRNDKITPLVGDFDSLTLSELRAVREHVKKIRQVPSEKDDTDTELAVKAALQCFSTGNVIILGATGGRLDHFLSNLFHASRLHLVTSGHHRPES